MAVVWGEKMKAKIKNIFIKNMGDLMKAAPQTQRICWAHQKNVQGEKKTNEKI